MKRNIQVRRGLCAPFYLEDTFVQHEKINREDNDERNSEL